MLNVYTVIFTLGVVAFGASACSDQPSAGGGDAAPDGSGDANRDAGAGDAAGPSPRDADSTDGGKGKPTRDAGRVWTSCERATSHHAGERCEGDFVCHGDCPCGAVTITCEDGRLHVEGECTECPDGGAGCPEGQTQYEPGCGDAPVGTRTLSGSGCYARCSGSDDTSCPDGTSCDEAWIDPCVCDPGEACCAACGAERWLCLEESADGRTPYEGRCARTRGDECDSDADCTAGGCGGELCYNPDLGGAASTCDCTAPPADCGCVEGMCQWYE